MNLDSFERYGLGKLTQEERQELEDQMALNPKLSEAISDFRSFLAFIDQTGLHDIRKKLGAAENQLSEESFFLTDEDLDRILIGNDTEKKAVEKKLTKSPYYEEIIKGHKEIVNIVDLHGLTHLKDQLNQTATILEQEGFFENRGNELHSQSIIRNLGWKPVVIPIAAAILILLGFFFLLPKYPGPIGGDYVWTPVHLEQDIADAEVVGFANPQKMQLDSRLEGLEMIKNKEYKESLVHWQNHLQTWPEDQKAEYYYAQALRETGQYDQAISHFNSLKETGTIYPDAVLFHLAICYFQMPEGCAEATKNLQLLIGNFPESQLVNEAVNYQSLAEKCR